MDFSFVSAISAAGMDVEKARLNASAINLANAHTTRTSSGGAFRPLRVVAGQGPSRFSGVLNGLQASLPQPTLVGIEQAMLPPRLAFEPGHPDADSKGFVAYPGIEPLGEMTNMMGAQRAYEANVIALNAAKAMAMKALEIGGNS